jgi:hypothetical protein
MLALFASLNNNFDLQIHVDLYCFHSILQVFQQIPGTLLVKGSVQDRNSPLSGFFLQTAYPNCLFHNFSNILVSTLEIALVEYVISLCFQRCPSWLSEIINISNMGFVCMNKLLV